MATILRPMLCKRGCEILFEQVDAETNRPIPIALLGKCDRHKGFEDPDVYTSIFTESDVYNSVVEALQTLYPQTVDPQSGWFIDMFQPEDVEAAAVENPSKCLLIIHTNLSTETCNAITSALAQVLTPGVAESVMFVPAVMQ